MGTRSLTTFIESEPNKLGKKVRTKIISMYVQYDGYPSGVGMDLANILNKGIMVSGFTGNRPDGKIEFNGMGCLIAQVIKEMKDGPGGHYVTKPRKPDWEDYAYEIEDNGENKSLTFRCFEIHGKAYGGNKKIFDGDPKDFPAFVKSLKEKA